MRYDRMGRRRWLPQNVTSFKDKCGRTRYRFRKKGYKPYLFRHEPGTNGFLEELAIATNAQVAKIPKFKRGTFDALIEDYYRSYQWKSLAASTQSMRRNIIEKFRAKCGPLPVDRLDARNINRWMTEKAESAPAAANHFRKILNQLMKHAIILGLRNDNPVSVISPIKIKGDGFYCWTEDDIKKFDERWPLGTKERLAKDLLLYTSLRRSDVVKLGPKNRIGDQLSLHHSKNDSDTFIRIMPPLAASLNAMTECGDVYLTTHMGNSFTPAGFGNWFRERCDLAGLPKCTAHGLRKSTARRLAESGATTLQAMAVTGHKTADVFIHYAKTAERKQLAAQAEDKLSQSFGWQTQ